MQRCHAYQMSSKTTALLTTSIKFSVDRTLGCTFPKEKLIADTRAQLHFLHTSKHCRRSKVFPINNAFSQLRLSILLRLHGFYDPVSNGSFL